jgi:CRISPR-associated protein (TIGR03986 family)
MAEESWEKGTVESWEDGRGIVRGRSGGSFDFTRDDWCGAGDPAPDMKVWVRGFDAATKKVVAPVRPAPDPRHLYTFERRPPKNRNLPRNGFINPYNFVRFPDLSSKGSFKVSDVDHSRFDPELLSGRIEVTLTTLTPLLSPAPGRRPESSAQRPKEAGNWDRIGFLRDPEGRGVLLGSSFRGAVRSVAEVLAAGCVSQTGLLEEPGSTPSWRPVPPGQPSKAGILQNGQILPVEPVLVPWDKPFRGWTAGSWRDGQVVWFKSELRARRFRAGGTPRPGETAGSAVQADDKWWFYPNGKTDEFEFLYPPQQGQAGRGVATVAPVATEIAATKPSGGGWKQGILHLTDVPQSGKKYQSRKKYQRIFPLDSKADWLPVPTEVLEDSDIANQDAIEEARDAKPKTIPWGGADIQVMKYESLEEEHKRGGAIPVWFREDATGTVRSVGRVALYRERHGQSPGDLLCKAGFTPCPPGSDTVCWSCAVFGRHLARQAENVKAFRSRVRFGELRTPEPLTDTDTFVVRRGAMGEPHPSCDIFYVTDEQDWGHECSLDGKGEAERAVLRGRKFYWHQPEAHAEPEGAQAPERWPLQVQSGLVVDDDALPYARRPGHRSKPDTFDQFTPGVEVLRRGRKLRGEVRFWNLRPEDLGLLLASLDPRLLGGDGKALKVGGGKPLGLGSVTVDLKVFLVDREVRYSSLDELGERAVPKGDLEGFVRDFAREALGFRGRGGGADPAADPVAELKQQSDVQDLLHLLDYGAVRGKSVHYPPGGAAGTDDFVLSFKWFGEYGSKNFRFSRRGQRAQLDPLRTVEEVIRCYTQRPFDGGGAGAGAGGRARGGGGQRPRRRGPDRGPRAERRRQA